MIEHDKAPKRHSTHKEMGRAKAPKVAKKTSIIATAELRAHLPDALRAVETGGERIVKWVIVHGRRGTFRHRAVIDTGTEMCFMPRRIALQAGTSWSGELGDTGLAGAALEVEIHKADIEIVGSGCRAVVEVMVPTEEEHRQPEFMIGSLFLQKTEAAIIYVGDHPVLNFPGKRHMMSRSRAVFVPHQATSLRASTSPTKRKPAKKPKKSK